MYRLLTQDIHNLFYLKFLVVILYLLYISHFLNVTFCIKILHEIIKKSYSILKLLKDGQSQLIQSNIDESALNEKLNEIKNLMQSIQIKLLEFEEKLNLIVDDKEILIVLIKRGELWEPSKNKFSIAITQPVRSTMNEEIFKFEESEGNLSENNQYNQVPPVVKPIRQIKYITSNNSI